MYSSSRRPRAFLQLASCCAHSALKQARRCAAGDPAAPSSSKAAAAHDVTSQLEQARARLQASAHAEEEAAYAEPPSPGHLEEARPVTARPAAGPGPAGLG